MHFRSITDLNALISRQANSMPEGIDIVVGIPRSGLLAASLFALHRNLPLTDLDGFSQGRLLGSGARLQMPTGSPGEFRFKKALVLDDSLYAGAAMAKARSMLAHLQPKCEIVYAAVYVAPGKESLVDYVFETCPIPRVFEWNIMHHCQLKESCLDIDGVLCADPSDQENDDGERYRAFLRNARPLHIPSVPVGTLVTCRLEKYRAQTEDWLFRHGVKYDRLVMLDLPTAVARRAWGQYGHFKGEVYKATQASLFIESSLSQALTIADTAAKSVFSIEGTQMVYPKITQMGKRALTKLPATLARRAKFVGSFLGRQLLRYVSY